jgi:hypothetical protein
MSQLDRLVWADGVAVSVFGVRVGIRATDPAVLEPMLAHLPPGWKRTSSPVVDRLYSVMTGAVGTQTEMQPIQMLFQDTDILAATPELQQICDVFEVDLQMHIAEAAHNRLFVHAGVVGWRGKAILIPGRTFTGKTTLVTELVRAGATYYSDEYAVLDPRGWVHPFTKPLSIREEPTARGKKYSIEEVGGRAGRSPLPVGLVVVSNYREGARWRPRRLSTGEGVLALLGHTITARTEPSFAMGTLRQAISSAQVLKGVRGDAQQVAADILERVESKN